MPNTRRFSTACLLAAILLLCATPAALGNFHLMKIREVYTAGTSGYVELQMWTAGQSAVKNHDVVFYEVTGAPSHTFEIPANVAKGESQRTVLIAGPGYSGPAADATDPNLDLPASGGAVCFTDADPPDCVSWGNFAGAPSALPSPGAGSPASPGGVTAGKALHRSIAPGCSTYLEPADDTNSSVADFSEQTPDPRPNAANIDEIECKAPNTTIDSATIPAGGKTNSTSISFMFSASPSAGASFECKLDSASFGLCSSPQEYMSLDGDNSQTGTIHSFQVRAKNSSGADSTPAMHSWTIDTIAPTVVLDSQPKDPSPGASSAFTFHGNEAVSKFECSLDEGAVSGAFSVCSSGQSYTNLADGTVYTFNVRATDLAGNAGTATSYEWEIDNSLKDEDPPLTTITSTPSDPSLSAIATFTYESNEANSTFECALDGASFNGCQATGIAYADLTNGSHSFQVRATDSSGNTDKSPAGYSWTVVALPQLIALPLTLPQPSISPPQTTLTSKPGTVTKDRTPSFRFGSNVAGSSFECKVDKGTFSSCRSPFTTKTLTFGAHTVQVRAIAAGLTDPTPAKSSFRVAKPKRKRSL